MNASKIILLLLFATSMQLFAQEKVIYLENEFLRVGILPDVGGRMVFYAPKGGDNFLLSDPAFWNETEEERSKAVFNEPFKPYNGFITWVGPQSEWWNQQSLDTSKQGDLWPPDPWLIYGNYKVLKQTSTSIEILGPKSEMSGLQLSKKYWLEENKLHIEVTAKNIRNTTVSWDLWSNARFDAYTHFYVDVEEGGIQKIINIEDKASEKLAHLLKNNRFTFLPEPPSDANKKRFSKAFLYPEIGEMVVSKENYLLKISFAKIPKGDIHPEQALIEIYNSVSNEEGASVLELEHHSAFKALKASEEMSLKEIWYLHKME